MRRDIWLARFAIPALLAASSLPLGLLGCGGASGVIGIGPQADGGSGSVDATSGGGHDGSAVGDSGSGGGHDGAFGGDGGGGGSCVAVQSACSQNADCCSHSCVGKVCVSTVGTCGAGGSSCAVSTDCCTGACVSGVCGGTQCLSIGSTCPTAGNSCCTSTCVSGKCAPIGTGGGGTPSCTTSGNSCAKSADCCSGLCTGGVCNIASSFCVQTNDICFNGADCCTGTCSAPNGNAVTAANPGLCVMPSVGAVNCSGVDGTLCDPSKVGCAAGCCSALCEPYGPTGVPVCTQAQGCHVEGDLCRKNSDCCGGESADAGIPGAGLVVCTIASGQTVGVCSTPSPGNGGGGKNACIPAGDVCEYNNSNSDGGYACSSSSKRADCCDGQTPNKFLCQLDPLGVPRCLAFSGPSDAGTNACRQTGNTCSTAADCCNGVPCVPDPSGQLVCASAACIPVSGACTSNADCCAGTSCVIPVGALQGACTPPPPPPPPPADAGTPSTDAATDAGICSLYGQSCADFPCCPGTLCNSNGFCSNLSPP